MITRISTTVKAPCTNETECCGCIVLEFVLDENAFLLLCNECGEHLGWGKEDWSDVDDRIRFGSEPI